MTNHLTPGMPVIINHFDRPCSPLIAVVSQVDAVNGMVHAIYLSADLKGQTCEAQIGECTPVSCFCCEVVVNKEGFYTAFSLRVDNTGSTATYHDGTPRPWQEGTPAWIKGDAKALHLLSTYLQRETR